MTSLANIFKMEKALIKIILVVKEGRALSSSLPPPQEAKNRKLLYNIIFRLIYYMNNPSVLISY